MRRLAILVPLLALSALACGTPDTDIDIVYDPCAGLAVTSDDATEAEAASIDEAVRLWNGAANTALVREVREDLPRIDVRFEDAPAAMRGAYEDEIGNIVVNRRIGDSWARSVTVAHELGHAFGLLHVSGTASLMNPGNIAIGPTADDVARLHALWPSCSE
ncbi:MAG: hypothetical protein DIU78_001670 [Pseudomonadota bacterium]|nr:MAG: hypothetical protein DIU78_06960 [Pseudomonadota bacterium]